MKRIQDELRLLSEETYADKEAMFAPTVARERCMGVRVPKLRAYAKQLRKSPEDRQAFLSELPHTYYDENMLHAILLSDIRDYDEALRAVNAFLPYVDNWATCDTIAPKGFQKHAKELYPHVLEWLSSPKSFICRFGLVRLMAYYLGDEFRSEVLELPLSITDEDYYVRMAIAWFYASALTFQWDTSYPFLQRKCLPKWIHNKSIQKACESFRVPDEHKAALRLLRM